MAPASRKKATSTKSWTKSSTKRTTRSRPATGSHASAASGKLAHAEAVAGLRSLLEPYRSRLEVTADTPASLLLYSRRPHEGQALFFAGTRHHRTYASYYLFPIDKFALAARRQGKSCFNFTTRDDRDDLLFAELGELTARGFAHFKKKGFV